MRTQHSTAQLVTPPDSRLLSSACLTIAVILAKTQSVQLGQQQIPHFTDYSKDEQETFASAARAAIYGLNPARSNHAKECALQRAEQVVREEGTFSHERIGYLARRIAQEAIITHTLALQGLFDQPAQAAGGGR